MKKENWKMGAARDSIQNLKSRVSGWVDGSVNSTWAVNLLNVEV